MDIETQNSLLTLCLHPLRRQEAEPTSRVNKALIENYRDYLAFHEINYKELLQKQLNSTNKFCKTIKP